MTGAGGAVTVTSASSASGRRAASTPRVLSIAGTDPTGGAGIQADLKSIAANGGYGMAVVTALVAQNTEGVRSVHTPPVSFLREQLDAVSDDVVIDAIKIGMLGDGATIDAVSAWLDETWPEGGTTRPPVVLDPVMIATSGDRLLAPEAEQALRDLVSRVDLVTPNLPELAVLAGLPVATTWAAALDQGRRVASAAGTTVLVKGGHLGGDSSPDALVDAAAGRGGRDDVEVPGRRVATTNTHGTGCSLSSALATRYAVSGDWGQALEASKRWLLGALDRADALDVGRGPGPIDHFGELWEAAGVASSDVSAAAPAPATVPATDRWWADISPVRTALDGLDFVRGVRDGSLDGGVFERYLTQDSIYLERYSRALSRASQLAPSTDEQAFWAQSAAACLDVELALHRERLGGAVDTTTTAAHPATVAYTDHLLAVAGGASYGVLVAAVLPCFWLYSDLGVQLLAARHPTHPYGEWLDTYADPSFAESTRTARDIADRAEAHADPAEQERMRQAFVMSSWHEVAFFDMG